MNPRPIFARASLRRHWELLSIYRTVYSADGCLSADLLPNHPAMVPSTLGKAIPRGPDQLFALFTCMNCIPRFTRVSAGNNAIHYKEENGMGRPAFMTIIIIILLLVAVIKQRALTLPHRAAPWWLAANQQRTPTEDGVSVAPDAFRAELVRISAGTGLSRVKVSGEPS